MIDEIHDHKDSEKEWEKDNAYQHTIHGKLHGIIP